MIVASDVMLARYNLTRSPKAAPDHLQDSSSDKRLFKITSPRHSEVHLFTNTIIRLKKDTTHH
jgi:hypothetical protein